MTSATASSLPSVKQRLFRTRAEDTLPIKIEHQRVYILPTRRGLAYIVCLLFMLVTSVNYALSLGYALCFLLTGMFAASLLHTYRNMAGITVEQIHSSPTFCGSKANFTIDYCNEQPFDRFGIMAKTIDSSSASDVSANASSTVKLSLPAEERGYLKLGRITLTSTYPLGLWRTWCYVHSDCHALVYPTPETDPPPMPVNSKAGEGEQRRIEKQGDIAGLRSYIPGDSPSAIAWKAAARGQGLKSKLFDSDSGGGETELTPTSTQLSNTEAQLSRLCAWVLHAESARLNYSLLLPEQSNFPEQAQTQKDQALTQLALFKVRLS